MANSTEVRQEIIAIMQHISRECAQNPVNFDRLLKMIDLYGNKCYNEALDNAERGDWD